MAREGGATSAPSSAQLTLSELSPAAAPQVSVEATNVPALNVDWLDVATQRRETHFPDPGLLATDLPHVEFGRPGIIFRIGAPQRPTQAQVTLYDELLEGVPTGDGKQLDCLRAEECRFAKTDLRQSEAWVATQEDTLVVVLEVFYDVEEESDSGVPTLDVNYASFGVIREGGSVRSGVLDTRTRRPDFCRYVNDRFHDPCADAPTTPHQVESRTGYDALPLRRRKWEEARPGRLASHDSRGTGQDQGRRGREGEPFTRPYCVVTRLNDRRLC